MKTLKLHMRVIWRHTFMPVFFLLTFPFALVVWKYHEELEAERAKIEAGNGFPWWP